MKRQIYWFLIFHRYKISRNQNYSLSICRRQSIIVNDNLFHFLSYIFYVHWLLPFYIPTDLRFISFLLLSNDHAGYAEVEAQKMGKWTKSRLRGENILRDDHDTDNGSDIMNFYILFYFFSIFFLFSFPFLQRLTSTEL